MIKAIYSINQDNFIFMKKDVNFINSNIYNDFKKYFY